MTKVITVKVEERERVFRAEGQPQHSLGEKKRVGVRGKAGSWELHSGAAFLE